MRIAFIRQRYNPYGGAERFLERAMTALAGEGAAMSVIAREWVQDATRPDAQYIRCDPPHVGRLWRDVSFARSACRIVAAEKFDLVQSHERIACCDVYRAGDGVHAQWLEHRARALGAYARLTTRLSPYHRYIVAAERRVYTSTHVRAVICNSRMVREDVLRHYPIDAAKLHVIYNGIDLEYFHPHARESLRGGARAELGIGDNERVFLFVGSGFARKGVDRLLRAFAALAAPNTRVVIVGEDRALARSQRLAADLGVKGRVTFAGGRPDVRPFYAAADAFVLPTLYDPFPNAAIEALACGLPVVTTFHCGAAELIRAGENGYVCDAFDQAALTRALLEVSELDPVATAQSARAAVAHLSLDAMAQQLLVLYRQLTAAKKAGARG